MGGGGNEVEGERGGGGCGEGRRRDKGAAIEITYHSLHHKFHYRCILCIGFS